MHILTVNYLEKKMIPHTIASKTIKHSGRSLAMLVKDPYTANDTERTREMGDTREEACPGPRLGSLKWLKARIPPSHRQSHTITLRSPMAFFLLHR